MQISSEVLSQPVSDEKPCGEDLEYDNTFQAMETAMQVDESISAFDSGDDDDGDAGDRGPDWETVGSQALELLTRTRDLRVFVALAKAGLNTEGLPAFHEALTALNNCMDEYWEEIHPMLDPDDDNDPLMRMNILQNLDDYHSVRRGIKKSPLVELRGVGAFSLHDIELATGQREREGKEVVPELAHIQGAFLDGDREQLAAVSDAVEGALAELARMSEVWARRTDGYEQPGLDDTIASLREVQRTLEEYAPAGTVATSNDDEETEGEDAAAQVAAPGTINSAADVIQALDRICDYYAKNEPSSPIPFILRRAQRLVSKSFYEILQDVAPDGINQFDNISGSTSD